MNKNTFNPAQFVCLDHLIRSLLITVFINCLIAFFLHMLNYGESLYSTFFISQIIGLSICSCVHLALLLIRPQQNTTMYPTIGMGITGGILLALGIIPLLSNITLTSTHHFQIVLLGLSFGTVLSLFFLFEKRLKNTETQLQEEQIKVLKGEKNALQMRLSLLQAQIEPHFLFNTLANIEGLLKQDVESAGAMLQNLTQYLRRSLNKSRKSNITLQEEMEMIRAYLKIFQIRMGKRLRYQIKIDPLLHDITVPPMLLQPLVENAILHGLEPKVEGGEIIVTARHQNDKIVLKVTDTGLGLDVANKQGMGLGNVRERLTLFYGEKATLQITENNPQGLQIKLEMPCLLPQS